MNEKERSGRAPDGDGLSQVEEWRGVEGHPLYEVSNEGRVRSLFSVPPRVLVPVPDSHGYPTVKLHRRRFKIHRLVCRAFHGKPPEKHEVAHLDGNRGNPRADNLKWATSKENHSHRAAHGTGQDGERGSSSRLTWAQVNEIRRRARDGESRPALAKEFGVARGHIRRIVLWEVWK